MAWQQAASLAELDNGPVLFKSGRKQIALFRANGQVFAIDNRCPHEGYPLTQGQVDDNCVLTCAWHNWKFRLPDGQCILGGDNVCNYSVKQEDGHVWVDLRNPPRDEIEASILSGLKKAFDDRDYGRICREIARLHYNKLDPLLAVRKALEWSHDRFEFGTTHAYAAGADWLAFCRSNEGDWQKQLVCLAEAVDHIANDALRHPTYAFADAGEPFLREAFLDAIEREQRERAEGMIEHALRNGLHWDDLEETFAEAALAHYNDFGHSLIYVYKTSQLLKIMGQSCERFLLLPLVRHLCYTTREDLLPEFRDYSTALQMIPQLGSHPFVGARKEELFPKTVPHALNWLKANASQLPADVLYDLLLTGISRNLLHFDTSVQEAIDNSVQNNVGWLDFTHGITFSNAVHVLCSTYPHLWRPGLVQMACFLGRNYRYLDLKLNEQNWTVDNTVEFFEGTREKLLDHGLREPIFSAHLLKTTVAVEEEIPSTSPECRKYLIAGLNRFLNSPLKQKHARRLARQADALVKLDF